MQSLEDFVSEWNNTHPDLQFSPTESSIGITDINVRYQSNNYRQYIDSLELWLQFIFLVGFKSNGTMAVCTDQYAAMSGIIDIKVSCLDRKCTNEKLTCVLRWIGEEFFKATRVGS